MKDEYRVDAKESEWLGKVELCLDEFGFVVVENLVETASCVETKTRLLAVKAIIAEEFGTDFCLQEKGCLVIPLLMHYDPYFFQFLELPEYLSIVKRRLGEDAILRNQIGTLVLPAVKERQQNSLVHNFHIQFRHLRNAVGICLDIGIFLDDVSETNGPMYVVPASHKFVETPAKELLLKKQQLITARRGSALLVDGMTWHREDGTLTEPVAMLLHQFTKPIIKQFVDFPKILGESVQGLSQESKRLLGCYSQVPASLEEYFRPKGERVFEDVVKEKSWLVKV